MNWCLVIDFKSPEKFEKEPEIVQQDIKMNLATWKLEAFVVGHPKVALKKTLIKYLLF